MSNLKVLEPIGMTVKGCLGRLADTFLDYIYDGPTHGWHPHLTAGWCPLRSAAVCLDLCVEAEEPETTANAPLQTPYWSL